MKTLKNTQTKRLMFSYGMNTNLAQMARRCPTAVSLGASVLPGFRFEFKQFATVEPDFNNNVDGVLWEIQPSDEASLDILEGYPVYYNKQMVEVLVNGEAVTAMTYLMYPEEQRAFPSQSYIDLLSEGYTSHGLDLDQIYAAVERVYDEYRLTSY